MKIKTDFCYQKYSVFSIQTLTDIFNRNHHICSAENYVCQQQRHKPQTHHEAEIKKYILFAL